ncbi:DUF2842 domain-containing protein [Rhizorhabdus sp. FW153]|uniref:DUF2842 domain-containing protein n=1 Tax=Rhizorhabdus sp. FW153 TaxID=3400216 RepID=UPI003CEA5555
MNEPSWRKPTGIFLILLLILVWAVIVATASSWIGEQHMLVQLLIYVVAGIVWIVPLKPLLAWMETGRWRP